MLMDLGLPVLDGWEATRRLKAAAETRAHPGHRPLGARHGGRARAGARGRLRRLRHQAGRSRAAARQDRALLLGRDAAMTASRRASLLVVDDNEDNRYTLTERLKREGYARPGGRGERPGGARAARRAAVRPRPARRDDARARRHRGPRAHQGRHGPPPHPGDHDLGRRPTSSGCCAASSSAPTTICRKPFNPVLLRARVGAAWSASACTTRKPPCRNREAERRGPTSCCTSSCRPGRERAQGDERGSTPPPRRGCGPVLRHRRVHPAIAMSNPPETVVGHLQALVGEYERVVAHHEMEKIKTIGDAFLATAGLFGHTADPTRRACSAASIWSRLRATSSRSGRSALASTSVQLWQASLGSANYAFDLWGDTVNLAARIAAQARPGTVLTSASTWRFVQHRGRGLSMGLVEIKGKGPVELIECRTI